MGIEVSRGKRFGVFYGLSLLLIIIGFVLGGSFNAVIEGYGRIIFQPSTLDFDTLKMAGQLGTGFFNAGILLAVTLTLYFITGCNIKGSHIAAAMMVTGFSFYGKNILNIWFPMTGVFLYTVLKKKKLADNMPLMMFSMAISPIFSVLAFGTPSLTPNAPSTFLVAAIVAILGGAILAALAGFLPQLHKGLVLYNAGFAAGIAATLVNYILGSIGLGHEKIAYSPESYVVGNNGTLGVCLAIIMAYFIIAGIALGGGKNIGKLLKHKSKGGDYTDSFGFGASLINMGIIGLIASLYVLLTISGQYCGPVFAPILTAVGFAACGVTVPSVIPIVIGVYLSAFVTGGFSGVVNGNDFFAAGLAKVSMRPMISAAIFAFGAAAITSEYGFLAGIIFGVVHAILVTNTGALHGWTSLYNNGYSIGLITVLATPLLAKLKEITEGSGTRVTGAA